ncbi:MAG TPA: RNA methyltransferase [Candidatus Avacidaminococcus intestinavium]|uniref:RNA methyltransferase n=1 Tax=Candidatus Avacidaminococcus intestinavium TaxID=2840684 RepID=A0A9D1MRJ4_9FIRM|nr:RNA methyltransferase [Candidatus Avacidaminococcus intestinavium]
MRKVITATANQVIKETERLKQKKYRISNKLFIVEGLRAVHEISEEWPIMRVFVDKNAGAAIDALADEIAVRGVEIIEVTSSILQKISDTEHAQGILAVVKMPETILEQLDTGEQTNFLVLDGIKDPGNLGTLVRTADAAGIEAVILLDGCVDLFSPKVVRSTMGSLFHIPIVNGVTQEKFIAWTKEHGITILCSSLHEESQNIFQMTWPLGSQAIVIGSEADGVSEELVNAAQVKFMIPMRGQAESLNAGVAAGIILFEHMRRTLEGLS